MMNKNASERPNRVVTCQVCGVQMPQRYLPKHMKLHEQAAGEPLLAVPESIPDQEETLEQQATEAALSEKARLEKAHSDTMICPACAAFVSEQEFANHMQVYHTNWCPLCSARAKDLSEHLRSKHWLKPIQPAPLYERSWKTQKRFICLGCKKKVSVWSYPKHEQPHGATSGFAPRTGKTRS